ncbi:hypothetical protein M405DRAFT_865962 [Rhizopogon salebrosus TDB-379]|nr:hypothetical protein M405DRAFT_865962 [Rhizopogon salebrosus TDB-379]
MLQDGSKPKKNEETAFSAAGKGRSSERESRPPFICYNCGWEGHSKARCWEEGGGQEGKAPDWWKSCGKNEASTKDEKPKPKADSTKAAAAAEDMEPDGVWLAIAAHAGDIEDWASDGEKVEDGRDIKNLEDLDDWLSEGEEVNVEHTRWRTAAGGADGNTPPHAQTLLIEGENRSVESNQQTSPGITNTHQDCPPPDKHGVGMRSMGMRKGKHQGSEDERPSPAVHTARLKQDSMEHSTTLFRDNQSAIGRMKDGTHHMRTNPTDTRYHSNCLSVKTGHISSFISGDISTSTHHEPPGREENPLRCPPVQTGRQAKARRLRGSVGD